MTDAATACPPGEEPQTRLRAIGDPTEGALVVAGAQLGLMKPDLERAYPRVGEIPSSQTASS